MLPERIHPAGHESIPIEQLLIHWCKPPPLAVRIDKALPSRACAYVGRCVKRLLRIRSGIRGTTSDSGSEVLSIGWTAGS